MHTPQKKINERTGPVIAHSSLPRPTDNVHARTVGANIHVATLAVDEPRSAARTILQESIGLVPA